MVDVYLRFRRAVMVEGMSVREASLVFGLHRDTARKILAYSVPPGYRRHTTPGRPKLVPYTGVIDRILEEDLRLPKKQCHTAKRIYGRLREEYGFDGGYTVVKDYLTEHRRQTKEKFVPLSPTGAELPLDVFSQRYERGSILVNTNLPSDGWTEVFGMERLTGALLDRLTHHVHILEMNGESYRLKRSRENAAFQASDGLDDAQLSPGTSLRIVSCCSRPTDIAPEQLVRTLYLGIYATIASSGSVLSAVARPDIVHIRPS